MRWAAGMAGAVVLFALGAVATAGASPLRPGVEATLIAGLPAQYRQAVMVHDDTVAAQLRTETALLVAADRAAPGTPLARLATALLATRDTLQPWPTVSQISRLTATAQRADGATSLRISAKPYDAIRADLDATTAAAKDGDRDQAIASALGAYAAAGGLTRRLGPDGDTLSATFTSTSRDEPGLLVALRRGLTATAVASAADRARGALNSSEQSLGDVEVSRATVVTDAAILVFREGLEAVLILAAITASFVGARKALRRPVLIGGLLGIVASVLTWFVFQFVIDQFGAGGLRLEAITGILAIAVLLVVTNWFFHRVYWSQWIARFNRRRKRLEKIDRIGFLSGQVFGLALLGLTSVYREGFETVLFLQNLQVSAGTGATVLGAGIGMAGVLAIGGLTFAAQSKLPYKKMLIVTGVLIALVLAVMTGTTVHVMQGLGWVPTTPTPFTVPLWASRWFGIYATWQSIAAQIGALAVVLGSYILAREVQVRRPQRRALAQYPGAAATQPPASAP